MRSALSTLTTRGRAFLSAGITAAVCAIVLGQKDLLRVGTAADRTAGHHGAGGQPGALPAVLLARGHPDSRASRPERDRVAPPAEPRPGPDRSDAARGPGAVRARQPATVRARPAASALAALDGVHRPIGGPRALQHRSADGPAQRPVRLRRAQPRVHRPRIPRRHPRRDRAPPGPAVRRLVRHRRQPAARVRRGRHRGHHRARVPDGRRPAPDPLALDRPRRRADGAPRGAALPEPCHRHARHAATTRTAARGRRRRSSSPSRLPRRSVHTWPVRASPCGCSPTRLAVATRPGTTAASGSGSRCSCCSTRSP